LYSLEALQPTEAAASKQDAFQLKGLKKILTMWKVVWVYINKNNLKEKIVQ
jgi:hypothetical protein